MGPAVADEFFHLGTIVGTHGLKGDLKVRTLAADSEALAEAREIFLRAADGTLESFPLQRSMPYKGLWLLQLVGRGTLEAVQPLLGRELFLPLTALPELADDEFYWHQLEGLTVVDRRHGELGPVVDLFTTAAHDIYVVQGPFGEVLIPVVGAFVLRIDLEAGRIEVDLPDGLIPERDEV